MTLYCEKRASDFVWKILQHGLFLITREWVSNVRFMRVYRAALLVACAKDGAEATWPT